MIYTNKTNGFFGGPTGPKNMHWANGLRIGELMRQRGLSQKELSRLTDLSVRTLRHMQRYEKAVKLWEIESVAHVLGVPLHQIEGVPEASLRFTHDWENLPVPVRDPRTVRTALYYDMNSDFSRALNVLQGGLTRLDPNNPADLRDWAFLCLKRDSIRSNAGWNAAALDGLDGLLDAHGQRLSPKSNLVGLIEFHRGVILRRMDRLDEAAALFGKVQHRRICGPGAAHQLGVLAALSAGSDVDSPYLAAAQKHFIRSLTAWTKGRGSYRAGFSEYRLGELCLTLGDPQRAKQYFYSASVRFESDGCTRYLVATRKAINDLP
jgi:transcriptional regulator with XRE-family HTH domain